MECGAQMGTISYDQFLDGITKFAEVAASNGDCWHVEQGELGSCYMTHRESVLEESSSAELGSDSNSGDDSSGLHSDPGALCYAIRGSAVVVDYHVVYSDSYAVPVLYFDMHEACGKLLSLEQVWKRVPSMYGLMDDDKVAAVSPWSVITQQEHPHQHIPYFVLHPCHTVDLMKRSCSSSAGGGNTCIYPTSSPYGYMLRWLSSVGPVVGLRLPWYFAKAIPYDATSKENEKSCAIVDNGNSS